MSETVCPYCHSPIKAHYTFCAVCGRDLKEISQKDKELFEVVSEMIAGDMSRFTRFFELTKDDVYGCLASFKLSDEDREDLSQEVYLKVFKAIGSLREVKGIRGWLKKVTVNCAINQFKKQNKEIFVDLPEDEEFDGDPMENLAADTVNIPEDLWMNQENLRLIGRAIDALPQNQKIAITAMYLGEMTIAEISLQTGMNQNTIKTNLSRGRNSLRIEIERIEKKEGVRLHSVAFTPFLYMFFKSYLAQAVMPETVSAAVQSALRNTAVPEGEGIADQTASGRGSGHSQADPEGKIDHGQAVSGNEGDSGQGTGASAQQSAAAAETTEVTSAGATEAASFSIKTAALTGKVKILAVVLAVAVAGGAVFAGTQLLGGSGFGSSSGSETDTAEETAENEEGPETDAGPEDAGTETGADVQETADADIVYETRYFVETYRENYTYTSDYWNMSSVTLETYTYDEKGNVVKKESSETSVYDGEETETVTQTISEYTYDEMGNLIKMESTETWSYDGTESVTETVADYVYDEAGTLLSRTNSYIYDGEEYSVTETTYDANGNVLTVVTYTDGVFESKKEYTYDVDGNILSEITYSENEDEPSSGYEYAYDAAGNQIQVSTLSCNSSQYTAYSTYDEYGNQLTYDMINYTAGYTRYTYHTYTYDANGNILTDVEDEEACNSTTTMTYDDAGRLLTKVMVIAYKWDGVDTYSYDAWDTQTISEEYTYDADGNEVLYVYTNTYADNPGETVTETETTETVYENGLVVLSRYTNEQGEVSEDTYEYDGNGNLLSEIYESAYGSRYEYAYTYIALDIPVTEE